MLWTGLPVAAQPSAGGARTCGKSAAVTVPMACAPSRVPANTPPTPSPWPPALHYSPQDYAIECPSTGSLFSLKDGSIVSWYPNNPVLRALTPTNTCRRLEIYPLKISQDAVYVDTSNARLGTRAQSGRGGAGAWLARRGGWAGPGWGREGGVCAVCAIPLTGAWQGNATQSGRRFSLVFGLVVETNAGRGGVSRMQPLCRVALSHPPPHQQPHPAACRSLPPRHLPGGQQCVQRAAHSVL